MAVVAIVLVAGCAGPAATVDAELAGLAVVADGRLTADLGEHGNATATVTTALASWHVEDRGERRFFSVESRARVAYYVDGIEMTADVWFRFPDEMGGWAHAVNSFSCNSQRIAIATNVDGVRKDLEEPTDGSCYDVENTLILLHMGGVADLGLGNGSSLVGRPPDPALIRTEGNLQDAWVTDRFDFELEPGGSPLSFRGTSVRHIVDGRIIDWSLEAAIESEQANRLEGTVETSTSALYGTRGPAPA